MLHFPKYFHTLFATLEPKGADIETTVKTGLTKTQVCELGEM